MTDASRWLRHAAVLVLATAGGGCGDAILPDDDSEPPPGGLEAGYQVRMVGGTSHTARLMEVLELVVEIEREENGYDGPVTFSADAPPGIVVVFRPTTVLISNSTDVLVVAEGSVTPRQYQVTFRASAPDRPDRVLVLDLTLTPAT